MTPNGPTLDSGAAVAGLEYAPGVRATVLGKPSPVVFRQALAGLRHDLGRRVPRGPGGDGRGRSRRRCPGGPANGPARHPRAVGQDHGGRCGGAAAGTRPAAARIVAPASLAEVVAALD